MKSIAAYCDKGSSSNGESSSCSGGGDGDGDNNSGGSCNSTLISRPYKLINIQSIMITLLNMLIPSSAMMYGLNDPLVNTVLTMIFMMLFLIITSSLMVMKYSNNL